MAMARNANNGKRVAAPVPVLQKKDVGIAQQQLQQLAPDSDSSVPEELQFMPLQPTRPNYSKDYAYNDGAAWMPTVRVAKMVTEYPLPGARETHEMVVVADRMLVVSQQTNSTMVKILLDTSSGRPISCASFQLKDFWAGFHGLTLSHLDEYKNQIWATLQFKSMLMRISLGDLSTVDLAPSVLQYISLPAPAKGPHSIVEYDSDLWTCCKDSSHVVRIKPKRTWDFSIYPCSARPIFVVKHPTSNDMYATLDISCKIWRLIVSSNKTVEMDIPAAQGRTPVGMVAGTDGNVWFTLLGDSSGGLGTFARILKDGTFQWFSLSSPIAPDVGLIHLAFDPSETSPKGVHRLWLLGSSLIAARGKSADCVFSVLIDTEQGRITTQESTFLPTQRCAPHRVLPHETGIFVSQMLVSSIAYITGAVAFDVEEMSGEKTDFYAHFGLGQMIPKYNYDLEY